MTKISLTFNFSLRKHDKISGQNLIAINYIDHYRYFAKNFCFILYFKIKGRKYYFNLFKILLLSKPEDMLLVNKPSKLHVEYSYIFQHLENITNLLHTK